MTPVLDHHFGPRLHRFCRTQGIVLHIAIVLLMSHLFIEGLCILLGPCDWIYTDIVVNTCDCDVLMLGVIQDLPVEKEAAR